MQVKIKKVQTLLEAIPYIKEYTNKIVIIKYGGSAQTSTYLQDKFAQDISLLHLVGLKPVIVHGGGAKINEMLKKLKIEAKFQDGLRVTCEETMKVVQMVLSGDINKNITSLLNKHGARAIGVSGKDDSFIQAIPKNGGKLGYTGQIVRVNPKMIHALIDDGFVPIIAPIATGDSTTHIGYNINADLAASEIASSLKAQKLIFMTDTVGVLDKDKNLLSTLTKEQIDNYIKDGTIQGGMIPKVEACLDAIDAGVQKTHIIDGRIEHSILLELLTNEGVGTVIKQH